MMREERKRLQRIGRKTKKTTPNPKKGNQHIFSYCVSTTVPGTLSTLHGDISSNQHSRMWVGEAIPALLIGD